MRSIRHIYIAFAMALIAPACSVVRNLPEGEYLLSKVHVEADKSVPRDERINASELNNYIRQTPNKKLFGTNFFAWVYNSADPDKDNSWNRLKRRIGEAPVVYSEPLANRSTLNLETFMRSQGFYSNNVTYAVDTTKRKKRAYVTYHISQGEPYIINKFDYTFRDPQLKAILEPDIANSLITSGDIFNATVLNAERERIANILRNEGYYNFTVNNIEYIADTLAGNKLVNLEMVVKKHLQGYDNNGEPFFVDNKRFVVNNISIIPNFDPTVVMNDASYLNRVDTINFKGLNIIYEGDDPNVRRKVLRQAVPIRSGHLYSSTNVENTYKNLMSMGYFKSARVSFSESKEPAIDSLILDDINSPLSALNCMILCTPALRQSFDVELEGSTTSTFYGLSATIGYQNRNIFKGAELFDASVTVGNEFIKSNSAASSNAYEYGVSTGLSFPRFLLPFFDPTLSNIIQPRSRVELSVNYQDKPYYRRTLSSLSWDYSWRTNKYSSFIVAPISFNLVDMGYLSDSFAESLQNIYLEESYKSQFIAGLNFSYIYNNQFANLGGNATMFRFNFESAGNFVNGVNHLFSTNVPESGYYDILGIEYAQYLRAYTNLSHRITIAPNASIVGRFFAGVGYTYGNSHDKLMPVDRLFYVGGSNSMRGWSPRTLGPGSSAEPTDVLYPSQLGDLRLEANLELRFPIWRFLHGATFCDVGNVWYIRQNESVYSNESVFHFNNFYKQLGFNTGVGLRLDIQFVVLRLDWGMQLYNPNLAYGERWIGFPKWKYSALNFGAGYPF